MTIIKSFSVGEGDMFYIKHSSDNFTIIDCNILEGDPNEIINEIKEKSKNKGILRFISTHPDEDHLQGLPDLDNELKFLNFYCVKNNAQKEEETKNFKRYCELRDSEKAFYISKGCSRNWMNQTSDERGSAGINILWPDTNDDNFKEALKIANEGGSPNNISSIIKYSLEEGVTALWMGDLDADFMEKIKGKLDISDISILFAPHHGRSSGKIPGDLLSSISPKLVIIGESPAQDLNYYQGYNTITQNSAGDIIFECIGNQIHIYVSNRNYSVDFLENKNKTSFNNYIGTLTL